MRETDLSCQGVEMREKPGGQGRSGRRRPRSEIITSSVSSNNRQQWNRNTDLVFIINTFLFPSLAKTLPISRRILKHILHFFSHKMLPLFPNYRKIIPVSKEKAIPSICRKTHPVTHIAFIVFFIPPLCSELGQCLTVI